jgi:hypothetical protein
MVKECSIKGRDREEKISVINPSETLSVTFEILSNKTWSSKNIPKLRIKIQYNSDSGNLKWLELYNVPLPY